MVTSYRVELAKTGRSGCRDTHCQKANVKIEKGDLRFGTLVEIKGQQSWFWKHWGCVTPKQLFNWKDVCGGDPALMDGLDELEPSLQEKVKRAVETLQIAPEDSLVVVARFKHHENDGDGQSSNPSPKKVKSYTALQDYGEAFMDEEANAPSNSNSPRVSTSTGRLQATKSTPDLRKSNDDGKGGKTSIKEKRGRGRPPLPEEIRANRDAKIQEQKSGRGRGRPPLTDEMRVARDAAIQEQNTGRGRGRPKKIHPGDNVYSEGSAPEVGSPLPTAPAKKKHPAHTIGVPSPAASTKGGRSKPTTATTTARSSAVNTPRVSGESTRATAGRASTRASAATSKSHSATDARSNNNSKSSLLNKVDTQGRTRKDHKPTKSSPLTNAESTEEEQKEADTEKRGTKRKKTAVQKVWTPVQKALATGFNWFWHEGSDEYYAMKMASYSTPNVSRGQKLHHSPSNISIPQKLRHYSSNLSRVSQKQKSHL
ncbi:MAG: hypothetical protein M1831_007352 [Alyxoria varia]|nr:MAG: hypothetical protein M1831_007352 [Alyxoria varia]